MIVHLYLTLVIILYVLLSIYQTDAIEPDRELVYDGTIFAIFSNSTNSFDQLTAVDNCISWGGNIASINSQEEDAQLFSLTNSTHFQCWIGLNKQPPGSILGMVNPDGYVWEDGSNGTYRKFSPDNSSMQYVKFRPNNYSLSEEWKDANNDNNTNCYFCGKTANSRGCDFTNNGSCYRTYQVDPQVNWYDAQSSCEDWGGSLTSITSEEENLLLFTRTPIKVFSCWAGMYADVNGTLTWNDGNAFAYTRWNTAPGINQSTTPPNCINWNSGGTNVWVNDDCNTMELKCYICKRILTAASIPGIQNETLHGDSMFGYFYASWPGVTWNTALQECICWRGSLASIESAAEDGVLYSIAAGNDTQCWIGLEKRTRGNETSIWADGSVSTYRNYAGQTPINDQTTEFYSLRSRNGNRTSGWEGYNRLETLSCFICQRPTNIRECQFTNDGFCYRTFLLVNPINWYDAQSNCVMWGGNLASITSEDEDTLLFLRTPYRADDCWIGLTNTNTNNGAYYWIDGEMVNYDMWTSGAPNNIANTDDCARNKVTGMNKWNNYNCINLTNCYICKRNSSAQFNPDLGDIFGELIHDNLGFKELAINTILYRNVTLICGDVTNPSSNSNNWIYSQNNDISLNTIVDSTDFNSEPGIKFISVSNSQQGFYQCRIQKQSGDISVYTVGVFDHSLATVAEAGRTYNYTVGIDRENITLLCDLMDTSIDPINYRWKIIGADGYMNNPIIVSNLSRIDATFVCDSITLIFRVPTLTITYQSSFMETELQIYPNTNQFSTRGLKQNFTLSMNIDGRWKLPDGTYQTGSIITYPYLLQQYTGLYTFYLYKWDGNEVPAIQTNITTTDNIGIFISTVSGIEQWEILQNNSRVFLTAQPETILCVGPRITSSVEWFREDTLLKGSDGSNILDEGSIQTPGYYNCRVDEASTYSIYIAKKSLIVEITDFTETVNYTLGSPTLLYHSNNPVPDSQIRWTTENIETGDVETFNPEYPNPVPLSTIFSDVGGGQHTFTCFYRNSPATVLGSVIFNMKDTTNVTISYNNIEKTFGDISNPSFPTPQRIEIPEGTFNINFNCNSSECRWKIQYNSSRDDIMKTFLINLAKLSREDEGTYSLYRTTTASGINYTTASIYIQVIPSPSVSTGIDMIPLIVIILVVVILTALTIFIISLIVYLCIWKRHRGKNESQSKPIYQEIDNNVEESGNQNCTYHTTGDTNSKNGRIYMCIDEEIDETTFIFPAEGPKYQNMNELGKLEEKIYEKFPNDPRMVPIPLETFKAHVDQIWNEGGSLEEEYKSFGGKSLRYPCTAAFQEENRTKNRFKLIYPYDKSRVVLKSINEGSLTDYINASYIPGFYVKNNFICSQAPKDSTLQIFWQMITENNVVNIVMVTNLVEMGRTKCAEYFPLRKEKSLTIGPYVIELVQEDVTIGYTIRTLQVSFNGRTTEIKHFHFTAWPDHDVPVLHDELLLFVKKVQEGIIEPDSPILVHCSAGVGRSGTFLSLFNLSSAIKQRKSICIYNLVHEMREHRPQMVQTFAQYKLIYLSVLEMLLGNTSIPSKDFTDTYNLYMQPENEEGYVSVFFQQYSELNYQCDKSFEHICKVAQDECNENKNPITSTLPQDNNRVVLFSPHWESDYINATNFYTIECVVTINPTQNTLQDFLQLIYQTEPSFVVMLTTPKELRLIQEGKSDRVVYWPNQDEPINTDGFVVKSLLNENSSPFLHNKINLVHKIEQVEKSFEQFISSKWNEEGEPDLEGVIILLQAMLIHKQGNPAAPILIHCTDGAGKSGVLLTVFKAILESRDKNVIDIFHIVKKLRNERMNLVPTLTHYMSCFSLMNEYCSNALQKHEEL